jgi:hypothetical protein
MSGARRSENKQIVAEIRDVDIYDPATSLICSASEADKETRQSNLI